jgi:hypothetical protein
VRIRVASVLLGIVAVCTVAWVGWRWEAQRVNLLSVNASGTPAQLAWQPQLFAGEAAEVIDACESTSIELHAGARWHVVHDRLEMSSAVVDVPLFTREVAVEIWLAADGSSRYVPAYPVDEALDAPPPRHCPGTS